MKLSLTAALLPFLVAFQDPAAAPGYAAEVTALRKEYQKAEQEYGKQYRAATTAERKELKPPAAAFLAKFKDLADRAKGTEAGAAALMEVFGLAQRVPKGRAEAQEALATLVEKHIESPLMERLATSLRYAGYSIGDEPCRDALATIRDKSTLAKAKAAAIFTLATQDMEKDEATSRTGFIRLKKEFADTPYSTQADKFLFELDYLSIGKTAPDFEATDEKGVKWKLSDYRGKVTVVDFWGFW